MVKKNGNMYNISLKWGYNRYMLIYNKKSEVLMIMRKLTLPDKMQDAGVNMFKHSKKTVILLIKGEPYYEKLEEDYPFYEFERGRFTFRFYFQSETIKDKYMSDYNGSLKDIIEDGKELGNVLGYPPTAIEAFVVDEDGNNLCGIVYHGMVFSTKFELVEENIKWLNKRYPVSEKYQTGVFVENTDGSKYVEIKNNNFEILDNLR